MATATSKELIDTMIKRGIDGKAIDKIKDELSQWIDTFHNPKENVEKSVASIHENPLIPNDIPVHGLIINPDTGKVDVVVNGYYCLLYTSGYTGAACLSSQAVLKIGAGVSTLISAESLYDILSMKNTEVMVKPLPEILPGVLGDSAMENIKDIAKAFDVVLMGPGLGRNEDVYKRQALSMRFSSS